MRQDKSLKSMVSIQSASENMAPLLCGSSSPICSTTFPSQQSLKIIYFACMQGFHPLSSIYLISKKLKECKKYLMRDLLPIWCGRIPTPNPATQGLLCRQEELAICSESMLLIDFCMRTGCRRSWELTNYAWRDTKSSSMASSAQSGAPLTTAIDFRILQVFLNSMNN